MTMGRVLLSTDVRGALLQRQRQRGFLLNPFRFGGGGGGGGAPANVQERFFTSTNGNGTTHDLTFVSTVGTGNTILVFLMGGDDVTDTTGIVANGISGTPALTQDYTTTLGSSTVRVYRLSNAGAGGTGVRITMSAAHFDITGWIVEVSGLTNTSPFTAGGSMSPDFEPVELDATAAVNGAGDVAYSRFYAVNLANITSTRSGFTQSSLSAGAELMQFNMNTGAGTVTAGASLSANPGFACGGFVVTYKKA
jgi:hypothetical protein